MRKLQVWGGLLLISTEARTLLRLGPGDRQVRVIVAATTKKRALELLDEVGYGVSRNNFDDYWCTTGNEAELQAAKHEGIWVSPDRFKQTTYWEWPRPSQLKGRAT